MALQLKSAPQIKIQSSVKARPVQETKVSLLKMLREKKNMSRAELSKLVSLSPYQIEGLENGLAQKTLSKFLSCTRALGYKPGDILAIMLQTWGESEPSFLKGTIDKPTHYVNFEKGSRVRRYTTQRENFLGLLQLQRGSDVQAGEIHLGDLMFGFVREGTLTIESSLSQTIHKRDGFFILPGRHAATFINQDNYNRTVDVLLFSVKFPG